MIHRLRLRNWRSYEELDLRLDPGTTFVVAPNGVGKTSLVYGLAWGVFGQHSSVNPADCIRAGAGTAEVTVDFDLPDGRRLSISRTARRRGAPTARYEVHGAQLSEGSALSLMEQAFGIELSVAGRLSMMLGGGHLAARDHLDLEGHLHHAFGVAHLLRAVETANSVAKEAAKSRAAFRSTTRQQIENRAAMEGEIAELEEEIAHLQQRGVELEKVRAAAAAQRSLVERHLALAAQLEQYAQQRSDLLAAVEDLLGRPVAAGGKESVDSELRTELQDTERAIAEMNDGAVAARSVISAAERAIGLLDGDDAVCPTCMQPLPSHQRTSAISAHRVQWQDAQEKVRLFEEGRGGRQTHAQAVSRLLSRLEALQRPILDTEVESIPSRADAETSYQVASTALDEHNQRLGGVQARLDALKHQIASDDQIRQEDRNLRLAYRREAAALAGANVLREAAEHVIQSRIEPLAREVRGRWKHLFTNNGLTFRPDGSITRLRDDVELGWDNPQRWRTDVGQNRDPPDSDGYYDLSSLRVV